MITFKKWTEEDNSANETEEKWPERLEQKQMAMMSWKLQEGRAVPQFTFVSSGPST